MIDRFEGEVVVKLKEGVNDPPGNEVKRALHILGFTDVVGVKIGKLVSLTLQTDSSAQARDIIRQATEKLLCNPVMERYDITYVRRLRRVVPRKNED